MKIPPPPRLKKKIQEKKGNGYFSTWTLDLGFFFGGGVLFELGECGNNFQAKFELFIWSFDTTHHAKTFHDALDFSNMRHSFPCPPNRFGTFYSNTPQSSPPPNTPQKFIWNFSWRILTFLIRVFMICYTTYESLTKVPSTHSKSPTSFTLPPSNISSGKTAMEYNWVFPKFDLTNRSNWAY